MLFRSDAGFALGWLTFVRYGNDGVMLVGGRLQVGCAVALTERWSLPILASALLGPLHSTSDDRIDVFADADAEIEVGLRVGVSYLLP